MQVRQSDLSSYARCPQQKKLDDLAKAGAIPARPSQLSATAFGSVMHHALFAMETLHQQGRDDALAKAQATFEYYWDPENISAICEPVDIWILRQTWQGLLRRGRDTLELYWARLAKDRGKLLALELEFDIPFTLDGEQHTLHGTIDRLCLRKTSGGSYLSVEDFKSGMDYKNLRWNQQFTVYAWATLQPQLWDAWGEQGAELHQRFSQLARRGTWISVHNGVKRSDAGWRGEQDYARLWVAIREYIRAVKADIYPLNISGVTCEFCRWREVCGGVPVPQPEHGAP